MDGTPLRLNGNPIINLVFLNVLNESLELLGLIVSLHCECLGGKRRGNAAGDQNASGHGFCPLHRFNHVSSVNFNMVNMATHPN